MLKLVSHKREKDGVITHLKVDGSEKTRQFVYDDLDPKTSNEYKTFVGGVVGAKIHRVGKYISTNPNETKGDNLDSLPKF